MSPHYAAPSTALLMLALVALGATVTGCPAVIREPALTPPPHGCEAGATTCHDGAPWRCGPDGEWSQADRRCDRLGAVCCATPSALRPGVTLHACVPVDRCEVAP